MASGITLIEDEILVNRHYLYGRCNNGISFVLALLFFLSIKNMSFNVKGKFFQLCVKLAPYTFGVYLIHDNRYIREFLWYKDTFHFNEQFYKWNFIIYIIVLSVSIFAIAVLLEYLRQQLFEKCGLNRLTKRIYNYNVIKLNSILRRINIS